MALEEITAGATIATLITTNPADGDDIAQGDDHIRNIKKALQFTFPNVNATVNATPTEMDIAATGGTISGSLRVMDTLTVSGAAVLKSTLLIEDALTVSGAAVLKAGLTVEGSATFSGTAIFKSDLILDGATDGGVLIGNDTGAIQVTSAGTTGEVLTSNGASVDPTFQTTVVVNQSLLGGITIGAGFLNLGDETDGAITHSSNGNITNDTYQCTDFTINSAVTMTLFSNELPLIILATGTVTIDGTINAKGKGVLGTSGVGNPNQRYHTGIYGGAGGGGDGSEFGGGKVGGASSGTAGGAGGSPSFGSGGTGPTNALIGELIALGLDVVWGGGASGGGAAAGGNGGAGGGCIVIIADTIDFTGTINVSGNNGSSGGGGGGGGIILMAANTYINDSGTRTIGGGSGGGTGGAGTVITITF